MTSSIKARSSGFSLIELMIGIVILAIAMAVAMPSYSQWIQNTNIRNAAESLQNGLQRARAEAVNRNTNVAFVIGEGAFWTVRQVNDATVIESKASAEMPRNVKAVVWPVAIPPALAPTTITFGSLGTVTPNADGSITINQVDVDSTVLPEADSRNLQIAIGAGGIVRMCDPNVVSTADPRHC